MKVSAVDSCGWLLSIVNVVGRVARRREERGNPIDGRIDGRGCYTSIGFDGRGEGNGNDT